MNETEITRYIRDTFSGIEVQVASREDGSPEIAWGDTFFFYAPSQEIPAERKFPFATIVTKDFGGVCCAFNLNRPGVFRLNGGVSKQTFAAFFGVAKPEDQDF